MSTVSDDAMAQCLSQMGAATHEQLEAARTLQLSKTQAGVTITLADALVEQGIITVALRENAEKKCQAVQQGGIQMLGNYKLLRKLGEGGMGAVYLAEDTVAQRNVALKVLPKRYANDPEFLTRFHREAKAMGKLNHENIVAAFAVGQELGHHFYVMEYCEGESLDGILKRESVLAIPECIAIAIQVASGLQHAHDHGFIHRDIKPANIFMTKDGLPKILDLGLSKDISDAEQSFNTQSGAVLGTPHYISPEQARAEQDIDGRTDIYSLGATLYHFVTGQTPFQGGNTLAIIGKPLTEPVPNPRDLRSDVPDGLVLVIQKMMAKAPQDRYASCTELAADLELVAQGQMPACTLEAAGQTTVASPRARRGRTTGPHKAIQAEPTAFISGLEPEPDVPQRSSRQPAAASPETAGSAANYAYAGIAIGALGLILYFSGIFGGGTKSGTVASADPARPAQSVIPVGEIIPQPPAADPAPQPPANAREAFVQRALEELKTQERTGALPPQELRRRLEEFVQFHGGTRAGREALDRLRALTAAQQPPAAAPKQDPHAEEKGMVKEVPPPGARIIYTCDFEDGNIEQWTSGCRLVRENLPPGKTGALMALATPQGPFFASCAAVGAYMDSRQKKESIGVAGTNTWLAIAIHPGTFKRVMLQMLTDKAVGRSRNFNLLCEAPWKQNGWQHLLLPLSAFTPNDRTMPQDMRMPAGTQLLNLQVYGGDKSEQGTLLIDEVILFEAPAGWPAGTPPGQPAVAVNVTPPVPAPPDKPAPPAQPVASRTEHPSEEAGDEHAEILAYEQKMAEAYALLNKGEVKQAHTLLDEARKELKTPALRADLDFDQEHIRYLDDIAKAVAQGAGMLTDKRPFTFKKSEGLNRELPTGAGTKNAVVGVKDDIVSIEQDLGGGAKATPKWKLAELTPKVRYDLAKIGMPADGEGHLKLAFSALLLLHGGSTEVTAKQVREHIDGARKTAGAAVKAAHMQERVDAFEREGAAALAVKAIQTLAAAKKWDEARKLLESFKKDYAATLAGNRMRDTLTQLWDDVDLQLNPLRRPGAVDEAFIKAVGALGPDEQVRAVMAKIKQLNPRFEGQGRHRAEGGKVVELSFCSAQVTDISPLRALPALQRLRIGGEWDEFTRAMRRGSVSALAPLKGMALTVLDINHTQVSDLTPLEKMPLAELSCYWSPIADLTPLKGAPLRMLNADGIKAVDLSPLKGMPLAHLSVSFTRVDDLMPVKDLPLETLFFAGTQVKDLSPLKGMRLHNLRFSQTKVKDLAPLAGMPLLSLGCDQTLVSDLSVLKDMQLRDLACDLENDRDIALVKSMKSLQRINGRSAADFWDRR